MPTVNIYSLKQANIKDLQNLTSSLKTFLAEKLTCGDIKLTPEEISIRFIEVSGGKMIGDVELEITAHAFGERVSKQDQICLDVMNYIREKVPSVGDIKVWLKLCELGHSWEK